MKARFRRTRECDPRVVVTPPAEVVWLGIGEVVLEMVGDYS